MGTPRADREALDRAISAVRRRCSYTSSTMAQQAFNTAATMAQIETALLQAQSLSRLADAVEHLAVVEVRIKHLEEKQ